jgi:hypothetical protein
MKLAEMKEDFWQGDEAKFLVFFFNEVLLS